MEINLNEIFTQCWGKLLYGSMIADNAYHTGVIGSQIDGIVNLRTVVLRSTDPDAKQIVFYTDSRSAKIAEMRNDARLSWLFYDTEDKVQLKISGDVIIHQYDDVADQHWQKVNGEGRKAYMAKPGPTTGVDHPTDGLEYLNDGAYDPEAGYANFAVITTQVNFIEWLSLSRGGHRRAQFRLMDGGSWKGQWLIP